MTADTPRTVRVRIAVAVTPEGGWASFGISTHTDGARAAAYSRRRAGDFLHMRWHPQRITWVEADVPLPWPEDTIEGRGSFPGLGAITYGTVYADDAATALARLRASWSRHLPCDPPPDLAPQPGAIGFMPAPAGHVGNRDA